MRAIIECATGGIINEKLAELDAKKIQLENSIDLELVKKKLTYDQENIKLYFDKYMDANMDNTLLRDEIMPVLIDDSPKKKNCGCNDVAIGECSSGYTRGAP